MKTMQTQKSAPPVRDIRLLTFDLEADETTNSFDVDGPLWAAVEATASANKQRVDEFILGAIREKVERDAPTNRKLPKLGKGWVAVNLCGWREANIRALCDVLGWTWRGFCESALYQYAMEWEKLLGVSPMKITRLSKQQQDKLKLRVAVWRHTQSKAGRASNCDLQLN